MRAFAVLLDRLSFTASRNAKLRLIRDHLADAPDPDRGWALAALTGGLSFTAAKPAIIRQAVEARVDVELFRLSYDYVGDLSETVALMWPQPADAGGGGDTWASTYLDVFRTLNELAGFAAITDGVIFHNTLASSDYGFLAREVFDPRPNYFAVLLWNRLMGTTVYDTAEPIREGAHVFAHSRKDGKEGVVYLVINNSLTEATTVELPKSAERYTLAGEGGNVRAAVMTLNGKPLVLGAGNSLPELTPAAQEAGTVTLAPATCTFFVL